MLAAVPGATLAEAAVEAGPFMAVRQDWSAARLVAASDPAASLPLFERAIAASPGNNGLLLSAAQAAAVARDRTRLLVWLRRLASQGGAPSAADAARFAALLGRASNGDEEASARRPGNGTRRLAVVPRSVRLVEGIAYDQERKSLLVSSVVNRTVYRVGHAGPARSLLRVPADAGSPLGIIVDQKRRVLWAALDPTAPAAGAQARVGGLLRYRLDTGRMDVIASGTSEAMLGDVTVAPDGSAYGADPHTGAVYRCRPGCTALERGP